MYDVNVSKIYNTQTKQDAITTPSTAGYMKEKMKESTNINPYNWILI